MNDRQNINSFNTLYNAFLQISEKKVTMLVENLTKHT